MREKINEEVSVVMYYNARLRRPVVHAINWQNKKYLAGKQGYHHTVRDGQTLHHIFELVDREETIWFRLNLNTDNLHWTLEAVHDGLP